MIAGVLFDLDGTLVSYAKPYAAFMRRMAARWGVTADDDPFFATYNAAIIADGPVSFKSAVASALVASGKPRPSDFDELCAMSVADYANGIQRLPHADHMLGQFAGLPKAIVSNGPADMQRAAIAAADLGSHFQHLIVSGDADVAVRKPSAAIFELACQRLGVDAAHVLMIGDSAEADINGALGAGLQARHVSELLLDEAR